MDELPAIGERVVLSKDLPGRHDLEESVGEVVGIEDGKWAVVKLSGPEAPDEPKRFDPRSLERWEGR